MLAEADPHVVTDGRAQERSASVVYVSSDEPGISRRRVGNGFTYLDADRRRVTDKQTLGRIRRLAVPPAWRDVWICAAADGHIQAVGYDQRGRKQYRYHARFRELRDGAKFDHLLTFAEALPALREHVALDMGARGLGRDKVAATVVHLLETTMMRVGNRAYARENKSYGLTTLRGRHVRIEGGELRFHFKGKSGKVWRLGVRDRRIAKIVKTCQDLPGQQLFQYLDETARPQAITSTDVNAYLQQATGRNITAKDFRTWAGTVLAGAMLARIGPAETKAEGKRRLARVIRDVASRLGNTPTICRKCYVHPRIMDAYLDGELKMDAGLISAEDGHDGCPSPVEAAVLDFLRARLTPNDARGGVIKGPWRDRDPALGGDHHG